MRVVSRQVRALTAVVLAALIGGCSHITTKVPGVLDLRSDASAVAVETAGLPTQPRSGTDGIVYGEGVQLGPGADKVKVVDRKYWAIGLIPILNDSATEELTVAMGTGALRDLTMGEEVSITGAALAVGAQVANVVPVVGQLVSLVGALTLPPFDMKVSGTRIKGDGVPAAGGGSQ